MTTGADRRAGAAAGRLLSIGGVLDRLRAEFPDVTISKIRFLEAEGLVEPRRTESGYRKFGERDVTRLAYVLRLQRDHYLPLKVIREHLQALDSGRRVPEPAGPRRIEAAPVVDADLSAEPVASRIGRAELLAAAEVDEAELASWEAYGLLGPAEDGCYPAEALRVARLLAQLGRFGLEPRHLRAIKAAADREVSLVDQVVAPLRRHRNPQTRSNAEATARELASLSVRLHACLVRAGLTERLTG